MPKQVDHEQRRQEIAEAVARLARRRGLQGVSFREVAVEAGMSVALVQHYVGTKEQLLVGALDRVSAGLGAGLVARVDAAGPDPLDRARALARGFLPTEPASREAMLVYHAFAAAALTDPALRGAEAFRNADHLLAFLEAELAAARDAGALAEPVDVRVEALGILALVLGLSLGILLERMTGDDSEAALDAHLARLAVR